MGDGDANGTFRSSAVYEMPPFPAYLNAFVYWPFSPDIFYIRVMNIVFGVLTCFLIYLIGKELVNRLTGLAACLIACLYKSPSSSTASFLLRHLWLWSSFPSPSGFSSAS